jgi:mono/diheme cytochrome c family protein
MSKRLRKMELVALVVVGIGLAVWFAARAGKTQLDPEQARQLKNPVTLNEQALQAAKAIYKEKCEHCHGETGAGDGPEAMMYDPAPANLSRAHVRQMTDGEAFHQISEGRKPMPPFKDQLTEEQRWQLVHYVRTFAAHPAPAAKP